MAILATGELATEAAQSNKLSGKLAQLSNLAAKLPSVSPQGENGAVVIETLSERQIIVSRTSAHVVAVAMAGKSK